ncbi:pimeloyl-ACP methyl esterase BioG family protein [Desulfolithobacter sp.]
MQTHWLVQKGHSRCLLFFAGWSMDPEPFQELDWGLRDVLLFYDYQDLVLPDLEIFSTRRPSTLSRNLELLAWSMGVWVAGHLLADIPLLTATALGGTCFPVDDRRGIPVRAWRASIRDFTPAYPEQFHRQMFDDQTQYDRFLAAKPGRTSSSLHREIILFDQALNNLGPAPDIYTRHIITSRDRIFPPRNQVRAWRRGTATSIKLPHFPFYDPRFKAAVLGK